MIMLRGVHGAPKGEKFEEAVADWKTLVSDPDAEYDKVITIDVSELAPMVTWGTNPEMGVEFDQPFPEIKDFNDERAYEYMTLSLASMLKISILAMSLLVLVLTHVLATLS